MCVLAAAAAAFEESEAVVNDADRNRPVVTDMRLRLLA